VAVGAVYEDSNATGVNGNQADNSAEGAGAAYVFVRSGTIWTQEAYLKASNTDADDWFGVSVAVSGDTVVVGAPNEDSSATGVNGNQGDNSATNAGAAYVFLLPPGGPEAGPFCFGDGGTGACPCNNAGSAGHGCANSQNAAGALLTTSGTTSPDTLMMTSSGELPTSLSILLQGDTDMANPVVFGDGLRCVGGVLMRLFQASAPGGVASFPPVGAPSISARSAALGDPIAPGSTRSYQVYYRDPDLNFCAAPPGNTYNVSNAQRVIW
jgi:hypothetical protein